MFFKLFLLFTIVPFIEMMLLLKMGEVFGFSTTLLIVIGTGALGAYFVKREGFRVWSKIQTELQGGRLPGDQLIDALLLFIAGLILITPGILTDLTGFLLLIPQTRDALKGFVKSRFSVKTQQTGENQYAESTTFETLD